MSQEDCVVVVLTYNCESIIEHTLAQAMKLCRRPFVVDSFSTDRTVEIAHALGCDVVQRAFKDYADQRNWAINQVNERARWQLHLDADEVLDETAVEEMAHIISEESTPHDAYLLRRVDYFMGQALHHSGLNPWHLRLFRSHHGSCESRKYDQHFVSDRPAGRLQGRMHDRNTTSLSEWTARHNRWSDLEVAELSSDAEGPQGALRANVFGGPRERARSLKRLYYRLPNGARSCAYFIYRYFIRLGFLDGREGFYFAALQAFWFRTLVDAKMYEMRRMEQRGSQAHANKES